MTTHWKKLFAGTPPASNTAVKLDVLVFQRHGEPLLIVPRGRPETATALSLYPAQTRRARLARWVWGVALRRGLRGGASRDSVLLEPREPFVEFLAQASGESVRGNKPVVPFAVLAGNPLAPGRRFLVLVFRDGRPAVVVKAGADQDAMTLIERELTFLQNRPPGFGALPGIPTVRQVFKQGQVAAFAVEFIGGESPRPADSAALVPLLKAWLEPGVELPLVQLHAWQRLADAAAGDEIFKKVAARLERMQVRSAVFHGDLAPWNIKLTGPERRWMVLDWERGDWQGPPAWDWFHYVLQPAMLVQRQSVSVLARTAEDLLASEPFQAYAKTAGLGGNERFWLIAYLLHCRDVLRPAEGSPKTTELVKLLAAKWVNE